jgi:hypothetical protein
VDLAHDTDQANVAAGFSGAHQFAGHLDDGGALAYALCHVGNLIEWSRYTLDRVGVK